MTSSVKGQEVSIRHRAYKDVKFQGITGYHRRPKIARRITLPRHSIEQAHKSTYSPMNRLE